MKKVYLSGPMTGIPSLNRSAFMKAQKEWEQLGYEVINPIHIGDQNANKTYEQLIGIDLKEMCDCDIVAVLPEWTKSKGALIEVYAAFKLGLKIYCTTTKQPLDIFPEIKMFNY